jgi:hypothetical protein
MFLAQALADDPTKLTIGTLAAGGLAYIGKLIFIDMKKSRKDDESRAVRDENLIAQTQSARKLEESAARQEQLLEQLVKAKKKGNKRSEKNHSKTHQLLQDTIERFGSILAKHEQNKQQ